jgi:DMSO/TMAO reductase YedYZ molybdopterin-dependent catalytic subunit
VGRPFELTFDELKGMEMRTISALLECSGNNRVFLMPKQKGVQWGLGAVGNAEWSGVSLRQILERAQIKDGAVEVIFEGADEGVPEKPPKPGDKFHFARSIPMAKAFDDVLIAWKMNGQELSDQHGFPARAIVPGWYGMASVKWLRRIIVTDQVYRGHFQTIEYAIYERSENEPPRRVQITEIQPKAEIARPDMEEVIPAGIKYRVHGAAWASGGGIAKVEVSYDSGTSWEPAKLLGETVKNAWQLWECEWQTPIQPGKYTLMARATDSSGRSQPEERDSDLGDAMIHHLLPIEVEVR